MFVCRSCYKRIVKHEDGYCDFVCKANKAKSLGWNSLYGSSEAVLKHHREFGPLLSTSVKQPVVIKPTTPKPVLFKGKSRCRSERYPKNVKTHPLS
jgi:hypothetical protein